jgi:hypothetical protein
MKKLMVFAVAAILVFAFSASSHAWTVYISNSTEYRLTVEVTGEHLFWRQSDCTTTVDPRSSGKCVMPVGICPVEAYVTYYNPKTQKSLPKEVCKPSPFLSCFSTTIVIINTEDTFGCVRYIGATE